MIQFSQFLLEASVTRQHFHQKVIDLIHHYKQQVSPILYPPKRSNEYHANLVVAHPTIPGVRLTIDSNSKSPNKSNANLYYTPMIYGKIGREKMQTETLPHVTAWALATIALHNERQGPTHETHFSGSSSVHDKMYAHLVGAVSKLPEFKGSYIERPDKRLPKFILTQQPAETKEEPA